MLTWIATQYFLGRSHKQDLDNKHTFDRNRMIQQRIRLLSRIQNRLANEIFERDPNLYISALNSMSADLSRILSEGDLAVEKRIETLEAEASQDNLIDRPSVRDFISAKEEFSLCSNDSLVSDYHIIASLHYLYIRKPVPEKKLNWALEKTQERDDANLFWRLKRAKAEYEAFTSMLDQLWEADDELAGKVRDVFSRHLETQYKGSDFKVFKLPHSLSLTQATGFAFDTPAECGVIEDFSGDVVITTFYRSDSNFESKEPLRNNSDTTITFANRMDGGL